MVDVQGTLLFLGLLLLLWVPLLIFSSGNPTYQVLPTPQMYPQSACISSCATNTRLMYLMSQRA